MSLYLEQIEQLIALQKIDDEIFTLDQELAAAPAEQEALQNKFGQVSKKRESQNEKVSYLKEQDKKLRFEIEEETARLKKSKNKMMAAENPKEYNAMMREMDNLERITRDRNHEMETLSEELKIQTDIQKEINAEYTDVNKSLKEVEANIEKRMEKANKEKDALLKKRGEKSKGVPAPVFARYEFIRERLEHPVIVPVEDGVCTGCNITIPPQSYIELQKGSQILSCTNCQRLMYWIDHFIKPEDKEEKEK